MFSSLNMTKKVKIIFTASILLNVVLLSVVGAKIYEHWASHPWHEVKKSLTPETRHLIARHFQQAHRETRPLGIKARQARKNLVKVMAAEEFDEKAFDAAIKKLNQAKGKIKTQKAESIKELFSSLPQEDREKLAEKMSQAIGGDFRKRGKKLRSMRRVDRWSEKGPQPIDRAPPANPPQPKEKPSQGQE